MLRAHSLFGFALASAGLSALVLAPSTACAQGQSGVTLGANLSVGATSSAVATRAQANASLAVRGPTRSEIAAIFGQVPLRVSAYVGAGWTSSWERPRLDGYAVELGGSLGAWATRYLAIEARGSYLGLLHRVSDANLDGRADTAVPTLNGLLAMGQLRLRLLEDELKLRRAWSLTVGGGAFVPLANTDTRGVAPVLEASIARHVGVLDQHGSAADISVELRARTGLGSLADYQSIIASLGVAWDGNQPTGSAPSHSVGYRPGHTAGLEALVGGFFSPFARPMSSALLNGAGGGVAASAGIVFSPGFELIARGGYLGRGPGRTGDDWLHMGFVEGGLRARWYLFFAEGDGGITAPFGTYRDQVQTTPHVSAALGLRVPFNAPNEPGFRFVTAVRGRVGLSPERTMDGLFFTAGFEFEGGDHHAAFPQPVRLSAPSVSGSLAARPLSPSGPGARGAGAITLFEPARIPLAISLGIQGGYIAPMRGIPLQRTQGELSVTASYTPWHWLALDARAAYMGAAGRTEDLDSDGTQDVVRPGFGGVLLSLGPRFRWLTDTYSQRTGWSFALAGGVMLPAVGSATVRGVGATAEAAIAREVAFSVGPRSVFGVGLELRGRTGFGAWGDYQSVLFGAKLWWEGDVALGRSSAEASVPGWRPGHTLALDGGAAIFPLGTRRSNGANYFGTLGAHVGLRAGLVFSPGFEWSLRGGWLHRPGAGTRDDLAALTLETGPRMRMGWISARAMAGYASVIGTHRDEVASVFYAGGGVEGRFAITEHWRILLGLEGRFALASERALDHIAFTLGFEFEGGPHRAVPFASAPSTPPPRTLPSFERPNVTPNQAPTPGVNVVTQRPGDVAGGATVGATVGASVGVIAPVRIALSTGIFAGPRGIGTHDLDGMGGAHHLTVGWVPRRWLSLELNGGIMASAGHRQDRNGDGVVELARDGLVNFTLTAGPRFRVLVDDFARYGWSFALAGGVMGGAAGVGPLGEVAIGRHLAAITDSHMALEFGVEARARLGWIPQANTTGSLGEFAPSMTVALTAAWEANVHRNSAPMHDAQLGETLSLEFTPGLALGGALRNGRALGSSINHLAARTGLVFSPGFEWSARAGYAFRSGEKDTAQFEALFAESGPRFRWGWAYAELAAGYAGSFGAYRDEVNGSAIASAAAGVRFGLTGVGHHFGGYAGVQARVGLSDERAYDSLSLQLGFEFEGGRRQAAPFPRWSLPESPRANIPTQRHELVIPRIPTQVQAGGSVGVQIPTQVELNLGGTASLSVFGTQAQRTVLVPGATVDSAPFGSGILLTVEELNGLLPQMDPSVRALHVELRTGSGAQAPALESALRAVLSARYGASLVVTSRVAIAASGSGRFELTLSAR
ncbi:MAG: hypothetical protein Q8Q09_01180 [Deltaproteobacteria bacterium]|nr:hypothetical protein [Deltaproteobacteria bacterium]